MHCWLPLNRQTMYYVEKVINGVLHYKTTPNGKWKPISVEELTKRVVEAERTLSNWKRDEESRNYFREADAAIGLF